MQLHTLTPGQAVAHAEILDFVQDQTKQVHVLSGRAGSGKSTLVGHLLVDIPSVLQAAHFIDPTFPQYEIILTATTHIATSALEAAAGGKTEVRTIQSVLGLRVQKDLSTGKTRLVESKNHVTPTKALIIVDEASYLDAYTLSKLFTRTQDCKFLLMGDKYQLLSMGSKEAPAFHAGFPTSELTEVVRNGGHILALSRQLIESVDTGEFQEWTPDGTEVLWLDQNDFNKAIAAEFTRPDWKPGDSRFLAYRNVRVEEYNTFIADMVTGTPEFQVGDQVANNAYVRNDKGISIANNALLTIKSIEDNVVIDGIPGKNYTFDNSLVVWFKPDDLQQWRKYLTACRAAGKVKELYDAEAWIDFRAVYAQTINKSQGMTYKKVFIDVADVARIGIGPLIARLLYVAVSRATTQVVFTGYM